MQIMDITLWEYKICNYSLNLLFSDIINLKELWPKMNNIKEEVDIEKEYNKQSSLTKDEFLKKFRY